MGIEGKQICVWLFYMACRRSNRLLKSPETSISLHVITRQKRYLYRYHQTVDPKRVAAQCGFGQTSALVTDFLSSLGFAVTSADLIIPRILGFFGVFGSIRGLFFSSFLLGLIRVLKLGGEILLLKIAENGILD